MVLRVIGLTGGVACGKSTMAQYLEQRGAALINADTLGHTVLEEEGYDAIVRTFGTSILGENERIERSKLGALVFASPASLAALNAIVHPHIAQRATQEIARIQAQASTKNTLLGPAVAIPKSVVLEAALLLETGWNALCDEVWTVETSPKLAVQRLMRRNQLTQLQAEQRIATQWSPQKRMALADCVIQNTGTLQMMQGEARRLFEQRVACI